MVVAHRGRWRSSAAAGDRRSIPPAVALALLVLLTSALAAAVPIPIASGALPCGYQLTLTAQPSSGPTPLVVRFNASVSSGVPAYYSWNFADGTFFNDSGPAAAHPLHRYAAVGDYAPSVEVNDLGCRDSKTVPVTVTAGPILVAVVAHTGGGPSGLTVTFNATVSGGSGTYVTATWAFGDGGAGSGLDVAYTYAHPGTYSASLNVTDSLGRSGSGGVQVQVGGTPGGVGSAWGWVDWAAVGIVVITAFVAAGAVRARSRPGPPAADRRVMSALHPGPPSPIAGAPTGVPTAPSTAPDSATAPVSAGASPTTVPLDPPGILEPRPDAAARSAGFTTPNPDPAGTALGLTQKVLLHIGRQGRLLPDDVAPPGLTQQGIAAETGARQNTLTNVLRRMVAAGVLQQDVRHVRGRPRRLRVYSLTARGESVYAELRRRKGPGAP